MQELQDQTYWGRLCVEPPILRVNPDVENSYTEVWVLYASNSHKQGSKHTNSVFKKWYTECCAKIGYDATL